MKVRLLHAAQQTGVVVLPEAFKGFGACAGVEDDEENIRMGCNALWQSNSIRLYRLFNWFFAACFPEYGSKLKGDKHE